MSNIDVERLEIDLDYWREVAPENATHYDLGDGTEESGFMRKSDRWYFWDGDRWETYGFTEFFTLEKLLGRVIEKPKNETHQAVEFPTGTGVLVVAEPDVNGVVIVRDESGEYRRVAKDNVKPISKNEQRDREELVQAILDVDDGSGEFPPYVVADAVLKWLKERN